MPERRWLMSGDFIIWNFPNAGNPQKVQRYPIEWAAALRKMIAKEPELLLPAHGLPISGKERIAPVLDEIATALENLASDVIAMMNDGATLDTIIHTVRVPGDTLAKPYLRRCTTNQSSSYATSGASSVVGGTVRRAGSSRRPMRSSLLPSPSSQGAPRY